MPIPASAVTSGRNAANSAPKAKPSTSRASTTPIAVLDDPVLAALCSMAWPPSATWSRGPCAAWATVITCLTAGTGSDWAR